MHNRHEKFTFLFLKQISANNAYIVPINVQTDNILLIIVFQSLDLGIEQTTLFFSVEGHLSKILSIRFL